MADSAKPSRAFLLFGTEETEAPRRRLSAGALSAELDRGNLRYIRWGGLEIIRAVAFIIRDTKWGTYSPAISNLIVEESAGRFAVSYDAECRGAEGDFRYRAEIAASSGGVLSFEAEGRLEQGFATNRTGFVVLHPLHGVVGHSVEVEHASGGRSTARFPELVSPDQPVFDIRALTHEPEAGLRVTVRMEGDAFEMEDHRNWTDASFKTYVRPLALGYPYRIEAGETVVQSVRVDVKGAPPRATTGPAAETAITLGPQRGTIPRIGLFVPPEELANLSRVVGGLAAIDPAYLIGRIDLRSDEPGPRFEDLIAAARAAGCGLALEVVIEGRSPEAELAPLAAVLAGAPVTPENLLIVPARDLQSRPTDEAPPGEAAVAQILAVARRLFPRLSLGGGMTVPFPELNRNRPPAGIDFVAHATQATIHAADDTSVMETLEALPDVIRSTRAIVGAIAYRLGPATIGLPASASASGPGGDAGGGRVPMAANDPRPQALFGAAFALGYTAIAAGEGVGALTLAATSGAFGVLDAPSGEPRPIAAIIEGLGRLSGLPRLDTAISGPGHVAALAAETPEGPVLWIANLGVDRTGIRVPEGVFASFRLIDADALAQSSAEQIGFRRLKTPIVELDAYAVCCVRPG